MANAAVKPTLATVVPARHSLAVRVCHWTTAVCFFALLLSGIEVTLSHPRFYWGEEGNVLTPPLFSLPVPASRQDVPTGYGFVLADQNGWSRSLHFQSAWIVVLAGIAYALFSVATRHLRRDLLPKRSELTWRALWKVL